MTMMQEETAAISARPTTEYPPMMDTTMVAEFLQMSPVHVRRLAREGVVPAYRIAGVRAFRFKRDEVMAWFESQRVSPETSDDISVEFDDDDPIS